MSNTGKNKILATFNCDPELWQAFKIKCRNNGSNATAILLELMELYIDTDVGETLEKGALSVRQKDIENHVNRYLDKYLYVYLEKYLEICLEEKIEKFLSDRK